MLFVFGQCCIYRRMYPHVDCFNVIIPKLIAFQRKKTFTQQQQSQQHQQQRIILHSTGSQCTNRQHRIIWRRKNQWKKIFISSGCWQATQHSVADKFWSNHFESIFILFFSLKYFMAHSKVNSTEKKWYLNERKCTAKNWIWSHCATGLATATVRCNQHSLFNLKIFCSSFSDTDIQRTR